jgi:hypothetical protein
VLAEHTTFDPKVGAALTLATAAGVGNGYMINIASRLAQMNGWVEEQVTALRTGIPTSDVKIDALTGLVREAKPAGAMSKWPTRLLTSGRRCSRDTSSITRKPIWMPCGSGADAAAAWESSLRRYVSRFSRQSRILVFIMVGSLGLAAAS